MTEEVKTEAGTSKVPDTKADNNNGAWVWLKPWIKSWFDWTGEHKTATVFFIFTILSTIVTGIAFNKSQSTFKKSQDRIVENQTAQIDKIEAVIKSMHINAKSAFIANEGAIQKLISDSLLTKIPELNNLQQAVLNKYIKTIVVTSASELAYKDWMKELNATLSQKEISQIQMESKTLLDLEFTKIQNEYESLTLWAGILTVVFLIFSFYSLFKADDLVKQGREGLDKLNIQKDEAIKLNKQSRDESDNLKDRISNFQKDIDGLLKQKAIQEAEIVKMQSDIANQRTGLTENLGLRAELNNVLFDITEAKKDIVDLQSKINQTKTNISKDTEDLNPETGIESTSTSPHFNAEEELDEDTKGESPEDVKMGEGPDEEIDPSNSK